VSVHVERLYSEVVTEPELAQDARPSGWDWGAAERLRAACEQLARDAERTRAEGRHG
jgi:hypothetical protein